MKHKRRVFTLNDEQYGWLQRESARLDISASELLRRILDAQRLPPDPQSSTQNRSK